MKRIIIVLTLSVLCTSAQAQQRPTPDESKLMDQLWRDTTLTKKPDTPPASKTRPDAPYIEWKSRFGAGDPFPR